MPSPSFSSIPVVGTTQLGDDGYWAELEYPAGHGDGYIDWPTRDANAYALRCRGDSMKPRIKSGEFVIIEPNRTPISGDEVLIKATDGRVMVKELLYQRDGATHLLSVNESHGKLVLRMDEISLMHYVAGIAKHALWHTSEKQQPKTGLDAMTEEQAQKILKDPRVKKLLDEA